MTTEVNGVPEAPHSEVKKRGPGRPRKEKHKEPQPMVVTDRAYFAAAALSGMLANPTATRSNRAGLAVTMADEVIKELAKPVPEENGDDEDETEAA